MKLETRNLLSITWPIFVDNLLRMGSIYVLYLITSLVSDNLSAILGAINLCIIIGFLIIDCIAQSYSIAISQAIGIGDKETKSKLYSSFLISILISGLVISFIFICFANPIVSLMGLKNDDLVLGVIYLKTVSMGFVFYSLNYMFIYIMNCHHLTKVSMANSLYVNISYLTVSFLIVLCNKSPLGTLVYKLGLANLLIRAFTCPILFIIVVKKIKDYNLKKVAQIKYILSQLYILSNLSIFNLIETAAYYISQLIIASLIASISIESLALRTYVISISGLLESFPWSIAKGNQFLFGPWIGEGKFQDVEKQVKNALKISLTFTFIVLVFVVIIRVKLLSLFTDSNWILSEGSNLLLIVAVLTMLKAINFNYTAALKSVGDIKYCCYNMVTIIFSITLPAIILLTYYYAYSLITVWFVFCLEECIRLVTLHLRWRSKQWEDTKILSRA